MTENEAINELQANIDLPFGFTVSDEVSEMAIKAIEKQIPKKPITNEEKENKFYIKEAHLCPICKEYVNSFGGNYCRNCGQKLDWEGGE